MWFTMWCVICTERNCCTPERGASSSMVSTACNTDWSVLPTQPYTRTFSSTLADRHAVSDGCCCCNIVIDNSVYVIISDILVTQSRRLWKGFPSRWRLTDDREARRCITVIFMECRDRVQEYASPDIKHSSAEGAILAWFTSPMLIIDLRLEQ